MTGNLRSWRQWLFKHFDSNELIQDDVKIAVFDKEQFLLMTDSAIKNCTAFIWAVADLLRGDYNQSEYGEVLFQPLLVRRLDCVLDVALTDIEFSAGTARRTGEG